MAAARRGLAQWSARVVSSRDLMLQNPEDMSARSDRGVYWSQVVPEMSITVSPEKLEEMQSCGEVFDDALHELVSGK